MAEIIFSDGTKRKVEYNQAARIHQILTGEKEPENEAQAEFCDNVKEVVFDNKPKLARPWEVKDDK